MESTLPSSASVPPMLVPQHNLARYLRVQLEVTDGVLRWRVPRALLGVIPVGARSIGISIAEIRSIRILERTVHPLRLLVGTVLLVAPGFLFPWWVAVIMGMAGLWIVLVSLGPNLEVVTTGNRHHRAAVCFGHRFDAELYIDAVTDLAPAPDQRQPPTNLAPLG